MNRPQYLHHVARRLIPLLRKLHCLLLSGKAHNRMQTPLHPLPPIYPTSLSPKSLVVLERSSFE
jgi:hypothetical protein